MHPVGHRARRTVTLVVRSVAASVCLVARPSVPLQATTAPPAVPSTEGNAHVASVDAGTTETRTLRSAGPPRRYRLHVPADAAPDGVFPLVVAFHGAGATMWQQERASGLSSLADRDRFLVVYPEGRGGRWTGDEGDQRFIRDMVAEVSRLMAVDPRRVYATGISNGGAMAYRAACELGDVFAAVATVAGAIPASTSCRSSRPVPLLALHGRDDRVVPLGGRGGSQPLVAAANWSASWAAHNGCAPDASVSTATPGVQTRAWAACPAGADVVLTTIDGLGHAWPGDPTDRRSAAPIDASATIWAFFAAHPMAAGR